MSEKVVLWLVLFYVFFLSFVHVKLGEHLEKLILKKWVVGYGTKRTIGWIVTTLALFPLHFVVPSFIQIYVIIYMIISIIWGIVYFDYIAKHKDINLH